jgi:hypothetical protein
LIFLENKTVGRLENFTTVDLLQFFKNISTEISNFGSRRQYGFKNSSCMVCSYLKAEQNVKVIFENLNF